VGVYVAVVENFCITTDFNPEVPAIQTNGLDPPAEELITCPVVGGVLGNTTV
jgi:hypothetical protein